VRKVYIIILFVILLPFTLHALQPGKNSKSDKWEELFHKGNQLYKDGNYESALNSYLEVLGSGYSGGDLYYNMGNACYRLKMIGHAVLYYERARAFMPRDPDLEYNLRYVRKLTKDAVEDHGSIMSSVFFWTASMTTGEVFWIFVIINFFLWGSLTLRLFFKKEWTFYVSIFFLAVWIVSGALSVWKYYAKASDDRAVVLPEQADVLSGPYAGDTLLFKLHAGTIVAEERSEDNWKLIRLPDDRRGWIKANAVEKINLK